MHAEVAEHASPACAAAGSRPRCCCFSSSVSWMPPSSSRVTRFVRQRQVLAAQPEVHRVVGEHLERHARRDLAGPARRVRPDLLGVGLAEHLDAAERVVPVVGAEVPVVAARGSSGTASGSAPSTPPSAPGCCAACSAGRPRRSCWPARSGARSLAERSSSAAEFTAPQDDHDDVRAERDRSEPSAELGDDRGDRRGRSRRSRSRSHVGVGHQLDVVVLQRRVDADHLGVGLGLDQAGEPVHPVAADAGAVVGGAARARPGSRLTPIGRWNGCSPCFSRSSLSCWMRGSCSHRRVARTARWPGPRSGPRRAGRAPGRGARPAV